MTNKKPAGPRPMPDSVGSMADYLRPYGFSILYNTFQFEGGRAHAFTLINRCGPEFMIVRPLNNVTVTLGGAGISEEKAVTDVMMTFRKWLKQAKIDAELKGVA